MLMGFGYEIIQKYKIYKKNIVEDLGLL